jgi:uncharacterized membrane protein YGL010W
MQPIKQLEQKRKIDVLLAKYAESYQNPRFETLQQICVPLLVFSLLGLAWAIPFPHLDILGRYNGFVNWASFVIAISVFYCYKLSPIMSYMMLFLTFILTFFIVTLEKWQLNGGLAIWQVCLPIFLLSLAGLLIGRKTEGIKPSFLDNVNFLLIGPIWIFHIICRKVGLRY